MQIEDACFEFDQARGELQTILLTHVVPRVCKVLSQAELHKDVGCIGRVFCGHCIIIDLWNSDAFQSEERQRRCLAGDNQMSRFCRRVRYSCNELEAIAEVNHENTVRGSFADLVDRKDVLELP